MRTYAKSRETQSAVSPTQVGKLLVYQLLHPELLEENTLILKEALFPGASVDPLQHFRVSPNSGWVFYESEAELFQEHRIQALALTGEEALNFAQQFFVNANTRIAASESLRKGGIPPLFPARMQPILVTPVWHDELRRVDHWLCRYHISLLVGREFGATECVVWGAGVDVRLGNGGRVIGLSLRNRPTVGVPIESESIPATSAVEDGRDGHGTTVQPLIVYRCEGEHALQTHYLPYYVNLHGHQAEFELASAHTFAPSILEIFQTGGTELHATVDGGSGEFDFAWGYWRVGTSHAFVDAGSGRSIRVRTGVYNVILNATDRQTGVSLQTQSLVYSTGTPKGDVFSGAEATLA